MLLIERTNKKDKFGRYIYIFECPICGGRKEMHVSNGRRDKTCGCVLTPRHTVTPENKRLYECWTNMKTRCKNDNYHKSHRYKERGITLCEEWEKFIPFQEWALANGYSDDLQIDRIDNDKGYSPDNCRWVSNIINHRNSTSVKINFNIAEQIRKEWRSGFTLKMLAENNSLTVKQIKNIIKNKHW